MSDEETGEKSPFASIPSPPSAPPAPPAPPGPPGPSSSPSPPQPQTSQGFANAAYDDTYDTPEDTKQLEADHGYVNAVRNEADLIDEADEEPEGTLGYVNARGNNYTDNQELLEEDHERASHDTSFDDTSTQMTMMTSTSNRTVRFKEEDETIGVSEPYEYEGGNEYIDPYEINHMSTFTWKKRKKKKEPKEKRNSSGDTSVSFIERDSWENPDKMFESFASRFCIV